MRFYEFFSGAGMAHVGFGPNARCLFANDFDPLKCAAYTDHFGGAELHEEDIRALSTADLPECVDVAWARRPVWICRPQAAALDLTVRRAAWHSHFCG